MIFQPAGQPPDTPPVGPPAQPPAAPQEQPPAQPGSPPPAQPGQPDQPGLADEEVGLLGDVQIEFIPELGVIILRGNRRDVERVQKIIDEIEKQSEATRPEVEVVLLQHTNSEAMTEVVTQVYTDVFTAAAGFAEHHGTGQTECHPAGRSPGEYRHGR